MCPLVATTLFFAHAWSFDSPNPQSTSCAILGAGKGAGARAGPRREVPGPPLPACQPIFSRCLRADAPNLVVPANVAESVMLSALGSFGTL